MNNCRTGCCRSPMSRGHRTVSPAEVILYCSLLFFGSSLYAQLPDVGKRDFTLRPMLMEIHFTGNTAITESELLSVLQSRSSSLSATNKFLRSYKRAFDSVPALRSYSIALGSALKNNPDDIRYLNPAYVIADTQAIHDLYEDQGYHDVTVDWHVHADSVRNVCALHFIIHEGIQYKLRAITYTGIDSIPPDLRAKITTPENISPGSPYSTEKLTLETSRVLNLLRDNGYAFAQFPRLPLVLQVRSVKPPQTPYDTVIISVYTGGRYYFGNTILSGSSKSGYDSTNSAWRDSVRRGTIMMQLEYKRGDLYNKSKLDQTVANLYALGVFDLVKFDTVNNISGKDTLSMRLTTRLRELNDINGGVGLDYNPQKSTITLGVNGSYSFSNLFSTASMFTLGANVGVQFQPLSLLYNVSAGFITPTFFGINRNTVFSLRASLDYLVEDEVLNEKLYSYRFRLPIELSFRLPQHLFINTISGRIGGLYTKYSNVVNYLNAQAESRLGDVSGDLQTTNGIPCNDPANHDSLKAYVAQALGQNLYRVQVLQGDQLAFITPSDEVNQEFERGKYGAFFGLTFVGDTRNDAFLPTNGHLFQADGELGSAGFINQYARLNLEGRIYRPSGPGASWALRGHFGVIAELGNGDHLTPISSRFFAGGANSMRGWGPRQLLVSAPVSLDNVNPQYRDCVSPILNEIMNDTRRLFGGLAVLEFSGEWRVTQIFNASNNTSLGRQLNMFGLVLFADIGNVYFRDWKQDADLNRIGTIIENLAIDAGFSIGYSTPIGPFRFGLGYPLYDPVDQLRQVNERWFWNRPLSISDFAFHIAIGHAF